MPLQFVHHEQPEALEQELRGLWRVVDGLVRRPVTTSETAGLPGPAGPPGETPQDVIRSWSLRLDDAGSYGFGAASQRHTDVAVIGTSAFTHLDLWLALEKSEVSDLLYMISVAVYPGIKAFCLPGGVDSAWRAPQLAARDGQLFFNRGKTSLYENLLTNGAVTRQVIPSTPSGDPWEERDRAYFPVMPNSAGGTGRIRVTQSVGSPSNATRSVCIRGYLTGRYIEHALQPSQVWQCATP